MPLALRRSSRLASVVFAFVVLIGAVACGGDDDSGEGGSRGTGASGSAGSDGSGADGSDGYGGEGDVGADATPGASAPPGATPAPGARFNLVASPDNAECSYVPNGHLSGADLLNVHFYFLIIGGNPPDAGAVRVSGQSDTGLSASYSSTPHNQAQSVAQFALRPEDFGRTHAITLTVDAAGQVPETDERDNRIRVTLTLPSPRPSSPVDPLACSVARA